MSRLFPALAVALDDREGRGGGVGRIAAGRAPFQRLQRRDHRERGRRRRGGRAGVSFIGHVSLLEDVPSRAAPEVIERVKRLTERIPQAERELAELSPDEREEQLAAIERAYLEASGTLPEH